LANTKITNLTSQTAAANDELPINRAGSDGKVTAASICNVRLGYIDIRDYGTVTAGGDITAAIQAVIAARNTHLNYRVRVPMVGSGSYTLDGAALNATTGYYSKPWIWELDCSTITMTTGLVVASDHTWRGMRTRQLNTFQSFPNPQPSIVMQSGVNNKAVTISEARNIRFEGLSVQANGTNGNAMYCWASDQVTIKDCVFGSDGPGIPLHIDSCFWFTLENITASPNSSGVRDSIRFSTDTDHTLNCGLIRCKELRVTRNGIRFVSTFGEGGVNNIIVEDLISEGLVDGCNLITFDSTNHVVGQIHIIRPDMADSLGTSYVIKNIGSQTSGIKLDCSIPQAQELWDPTNTPIDDLVIDESLGGFFQNTPITRNFQPDSVGTSKWGSWSRYGPTSIDARLACAPIGLPWVIGSPLNVTQDPASWTAVSGSTITSGITAPDGSTRAGRVSGGGGARCFFSNSTTVSADDYFLIGVWIRPTAAGRSIYDTTTTFSVTGYSLNGQGASLIVTQQFFEDSLEGPGWRWTSVLAKVTSAGSDTTPDMQLVLGVSGAAADYFNPCIIQIPASAGIDDIWMINWARSLKGGWPAGAVQGDVALLDHQKLKIGGGVRLFSSSSVPTTGTGAVGDIAFNSAPASGEPLGWVCVGAGTPGTWMGLATITDAAMVLSATGTGTSTFVGQAASGSVTGALSATGSGSATLFVGSAGNGSLGLLSGETQGFAIDATTELGTVSIIDTTNPLNDRTNDGINSANLVQSGTSGKNVLGDDGLLHIVASGQIAQEYDATDSRWAILVEPAATNLVLHSEEHDDADWTATQVTVTPDAVTDPKGTVTGTQVTTTGTSAELTNTTAITVTTATTYTHSVFVKAGTGCQWFECVLWDGSAAGTRSWFDVSNGVTGTTSTFGAGWSVTSTAIQTIGSGWYRLSTTFVTSGTSLEVTYVPTTADGATTRDSIGTIYEIWGSQVETGSVRTSYITTSTAAVTRAADRIGCSVLTYPHSDATGTFIVWVKSRTINTALAARLVSVTDGTTSERLILTQLTTGSPDNFDFTVTDGGVAQTTLTLTNGVSLSGNKIGAAYQVNNTGLLRDAGAETTDTSCTMPTVTLFALGHGSDDTPLREFNGYIYQMTYIPRRLTEAEMQTKTT
jgi:hypothetical protein